MKGFINLLKPEGMSSAYAVGAVKYKFKTPCGHMGTLDPMASGVLPVGIGKTSRLFPFLLDKIKTYEAVIKFGITTDTLDSTGETINTTNVIPTADQVRSSLGQFIGEILQVPPKYSAKCVNGKRGYELSRKGIDFELEPKKVVVYDVSLLEQLNECEYVLKIVCGGGTYVRSLCRDIGNACGSLAIMSGLKRTSSGKFTLENGVDFYEFKNSDNPEKYIIPSDFAVDFEKILLSEKQAQKILDGVFDNLGYKDGIYRVYNQSEFWGIGKAQEGVLKIIAYVR